MQAFMVVLTTCKKEEDPIKNEITRVITTLNINFRRSREGNYVVGGGVGRNSKFIQAFMVFLVTCKNDEDQSKNELTIVLKTSLPLLVCDFFQTFKGS